MGYQESLIKVKDQRYFDDIVEYLDKNKERIEELLSINTIVTFKENIGEFKAKEKAICVSGERAANKIDYIFNNNLAKRVELIPIENLPNLDKIFKTHELAKETDFYEYVKDQELELSR